MCPPDCNIGVAGIATTLWDAGVHAIAQSAIGFAKGVFSAARRSGALEGLAAAVTEGGSEELEVATTELRATERVSGGAVRKLASRIEADGGIKESLKYVEHNEKSLSLTVITGFRQHGNWESRMCLLSGSLCRTKDSRQYRICFTDAVR
jgi:hypothetical protein